MAFGGRRATTTTTIEVGPAENKPGAVRTAKMATSMAMAMATAAEAEAEAEANAETEAKWVAPRSVTFSACGQSDTTASSRCCHGAVSCLVGGVCGGWGPPSICARAAARPKLHSMGGQGFTKRYEVQVPISPLSSLRT